MERNENFYEILEVPFGASEEVISHSYKVLSKKHHPDNFQSAKDKATAHEQMIKLNAAKEILLDREKRKEYDERIKPALQYEQELHNSLSNDYNIERKLKDLWQWILNFQGDAIDKVKASYFAEDHSRSRLQPPRTGDVNEDIYIRRRPMRW